MRKLIAAGVVVGTASLYAGPGEADNFQSRYESAAHVLTEECAQQFATQFPASFLQRLVEVDIARSETDDTTTPAERRAKAEGYDLSPYPSVNDYIEDNTKFIDFVRLPQSLIGIRLSSDNPEWKLDPVVFDEIIRSTLSSRTGSESLQALNYQCTEKSLYEEQLLAYANVEVYILGLGELCIAGSKVIPRNLGICPTGGRFYDDDNRIVVLPGPSNPAVSGSSILAHEFRHFTDDALSAEGKESLQREFSAETFQDIAAHQMRTNNSYPLSHASSTSCSTMVDTTFLC